MIASSRIPPHWIVFAGFYVYSLCLGGLFPRLGDLQIDMGIGKDVLGRALIGVAIGTQISLMFSGPLIERVGYRRTLALSIPLLAVFWTIAGVSTGPWMLFGILALAGLQVGVIEIVLNVETDRIENMTGRRIMNRAHAFWSFGFFSSAMIAAGAKQWQVSAWTHLGVMAILTTVATLLLVRDYHPAPARQTDEGPPPRFVRPTGPILVLAAFTLSSMLLEGGVIDWSAIYMRDIFGSAPFLQAFALAIAALFQATVRFYADGFVDRFGPVPLARFLIAVLGTGVLAVTFAPNATVALIGFALIGIGTSAIFPLAMSAAAQRTDRPAGMNVAGLAQLSFITFLVAPPVLGQVAETFGLRASYGIAIPLVVLSWFTLSALKPKP